MARSVVASLVISVLLLAAIAPASMLAQALEVEVTPTAATAINELQGGFTPWGPGWRDGSSGFAGHHYWGPGVAEEEPRRRLGCHAGPGGAVSGPSLHPARHASSRAAVYRVLTADGWALRVGNQWLRRGKWSNLGVHELSTRAEVRLTDKTRDPRGTRRKLAFDALRFVALDAPPPATTPAPTPAPVVPSAPTGVSATAGDGLRAGLLDGARLGRRQPPHRLRGDALHRRDGPARGQRRRDGHEPHRHGPHQRHGLHLHAWPPSTPWAPVPTRHPPTRSPRATGRPARPPV